MKCRLKDPISAISNSDSPVFGMRLEDVNGKLSAFRVPSKDTLSSAYRVLFESGDISYKMNYDVFTKYFSEDVPVPSDSDLGVGDFEERGEIDPADYPRGGTAQPRLEIARPKSYTDDLLMDSARLYNEAENESKRRREIYDKAGAAAVKAYCNSKTEAPSVYHKWFDEGYHDVYSIARKFDITDPAQAHGLKKNLIAGGRNKVGKSAIDDIKECIWSLQNYLEYLESLDEN